MLTVRNYIEAAKRRKKEETGEEGFSLIELIIVVVILGILVAIALPIFSNIQKTAIDGATESATKNAATTAVADIAQDSTAAGVTQAQTDATAIATKTSANLTLTVGTRAAGGGAFTAGGTPTPATLCVQGYDTGGSKYKAAGSAFYSGPGC